MGLISFNVQLPKMGSFSGLGSKLASKVGSLDFDSKISGASGGLVDKLTSQVSSQIGNLDMSNMQMPEIDMSSLNETSGLDVNSEIEKMIGEINSGNF